MAESNSFLPAVKTRTITESEYRDLVARVERAERAAARADRDSADRDLLEGSIIAVDDLARALEAARELGEPPVLIDGVQLASESLRQALERRGVTRIDIAAGDAYDPELHQVLDPEAIVDESLRIAVERRAGYRFAGSVLRRAIVELAPEKA